MKAVKTKSPTYKPVRYMFILTPDEDAFLTRISTESQQHKSVHLHKALAAYRERFVSLFHKPAPPAGR